MNPDLDKLLPYPFERLSALLRGIPPDPESPPVSLAIGEPRHPPPAFVTEELISHLHGLAHYPVTKGGHALREAIAGWLTRRYGLPSASLDPERHVLPVNGTREALFAFAQCCIDRSEPALVMMPNPFYQIYEGAALLAGAQPWYINTGPQTHWLPDFESIPDSAWQRCQLLYLCSPGNPTGAVLDAATLQHLIGLAERHDFVIAADECYAEIYHDGDAPPCGLLQAAAAAGNTGFRRCIVFHSLSKRSNLPGLRSGFVAGDAEVIARFLRYRTYHGCSMPPPAQAASIAAWSDEGHVHDNRALYREKFDAVLEVLAPVLEVERPAAGFYLWPATPVEDTEFARGLYRQEHITVLPGRYLSRKSEGIDPGAGRMRIALVPPLDECVDAARRIRRYVEALGAG